MSTTEGRFSISFPKKQFIILVTAVGFKVYIIDSSLFNWSASQNIIDRLPTGIVLSHPDIIPGANQSPITIRNRITIIAHPHPLIILNGIPYHGDLSNINPNDIESMTVVKDAAASTQFGLHAANGVIVVTTKSSHYNKPVRISATANFTIGMKPNLSYVPYMSAADHIELTRSLFENGYYDNLLRNSPWYPFPPAVEILYREKIGLLTHADAEEALAALRTIDIRKDVRKYFYHPAIHQQYHAGVQGGNDIYHYNYSLGYDAAKGNLKGNSNTRFTLYIDHAIKAGKKGPEIFNTINYTQNIIDNNGIDLFNFKNPYENPVDGNGNSRSITDALNQTYKDSITQAAKLLNWDNKPLDEIGLGNNKTTTTAFHFTFGLRYHFLKKLDATVTFRQETETSKHINRHTEQSYFTRDLINSFSQIDSNGDVYRPVPLGAIVDRNFNKRNAGNISALLKYDALNDEKNTLTFNTEACIRHIRSNNQTQRDYGVIGNGPKAIVDHTTFFSTPYEPGIARQIPNINDSVQTREHYYSIYVNGVYTWRKRLQASFSYRKDESNIFGVQANMKRVPLLAVGISWDLSPKNYNSNRALSILRLRISDGNCSNASKSVSSLTGLQSVGSNPWNAPINAVINPPNPRLSWETVHISNIGLDFSLFKNRIWGTTEFFVKRGNDLLGMAPIDPTSGVSIFQGNVAAMKGHGLELVLNTRFGNKIFQWQSTTFMSYIRDKVTRYSIQRPSIWYYCDPRYINPMPGKPLFSMYSLPFHGLDPNTGDPIGYLANQPTKNYNAIIQSPDVSDLVYHGSATPTFYGSIRNILTWKKLELGFNIVWKAGYYIRKNSINYHAVINNEAVGHSDIAKRWQQPGDEDNTKIPSLRFPVDYSRDLFFNFSSALIEKGDHIRLQDIRLKYYFNKFELYIYSNNIGLLWKANRNDIDPDYPNGLPLPPQVSIGTKIELQNNR